MKSRFFKATTLSSQDSLKLEMADFKWCFKSFPNAKVFCSFFEKGHYKIVLRSISTFLPKFW